MLEEEKKKILELSNPNDKIILDVGCGDGRYSTVLSNLCKKYVGIDVNKKLVELNNKNNTKNNVFYEYANIAQYNPAEKFDIIILSLVFHEIDVKEQGLALFNILNLLKKDGKVIILDPTLDDDSFQALWNVAYENLKFFDHNYVVRHSQDVISKAIKAKICKVSCKDTLNIPFEFSDFSQVIEMIENDEEFELIKWDDKKRKILENKLRNFLKTDKNIVLYDKLDITVLQRSDD